MPEHDVVVCSFHTPDDYYRSHGEKLQRTLDRLEIPSVIRTIEKEPGQDWADVTRKKVGFLADVCDERPDSLVMWIDVDCSLLSLPDYVRGATADLVGFQRGFGSPLRIGYAQRTRFWEPCFFGINSTPLGRAFIRRARELEASTPIRATDDYFFEEAWRELASDLSFQIIPSTAVLHRADTSGTDGLRAETFFNFGSSGNVAEFKDKVVQHDDPLGMQRSGGDKLRRRGLAAAKKIERLLPRRVAGPLRRMVDSSGVTQALTGGDLAPSRLLSAGVSSPHRQRIVTSMVVASQRADRAAVDTAYARLVEMGNQSSGEIAARQAAESFLAFGRPDDEAEPLKVAWWVRPFPGNFGDWLSPLIVQSHSDRPIRFQALTAKSSDPHLVAVGSVGRFIKPTSVVVGTGISTTDVELDPRASYHSVRGPVTAEQLRASGGPTVDSFADPGVLLRRVLPVERGETNGKLALVRHFTHVPLPVQLPDDVEELSVLVSHPEQIHELVRSLASYDGVVTSAMHVMIACHSYGIPCALVTFEGLESAVHGSGIKYGDYAQGAEVEVHEPVAIGSDLRRTDLRAMLHSERTPDHVLDRAEAAMAAAIAELQQRQADRSSVSA